MAPSRGTVAAGHPRSAEIAAAVLREGGTAADATVAGTFASWVCEPLLTGPAAGGHLLAVPPDGPALAIDAFCQVPGRRPADAGERERTARDPLDGLHAVEVDFGDAHQVFHVGGASVAAFGLLDGLVRLHERWGRLPLADLAAPAAAMAREGVVLNRQQAFVADLLHGILVSSPESAALWAPGDLLLREGDLLRDPELGDTIERLGAEGVAPLRDGDLAAACVDWAARHGGVLTRADLAGYRAVERAPIRLPYRDRTVLTVPPPSAGGVLLALALARLDRDAARAGGVRAPVAVGRHAEDAEGPSPAELVAAMADADAERTDAFEQGLVREGFADELLRLRLGSTTHLSVIDADGLSCAITTTNGEGSGVIVPGTGIHLNNIMGEEDLNPRLRGGEGSVARDLAPFPPGRRMPSMMAPTAVLGPGGPAAAGGPTIGTVEAILGSAGSARIRSALLQTVVGLVDRGLGPVGAVEAPRIHVEEGVVYAEPGLLGAVGDWTGGRTAVEFRAQNLYFGGVQLVARDPATGVLTGAADPRRGGAVAVA
ncbi:gamma-glutamyltransferase [Patulibacter minatonensis]|uniref:gamma-glutamyltransferase n=1 Tax=Patulibacter minatonensis TaxID=298163 RepID=UPI00047D92F9|nr:gamma-glutamyltransferase [Patulibacter minatonensis]